MWPQTKSVWRVLCKLKRDMHNDPEIPLLSIYSKDSIYAYRDIYTSNCSIHSSTEMESCNMPINRWMDNESVVHIYSGFVFFFLFKIILFIYCLSGGETPVIAYIWRPEDIWRNWIFAPIIWVQGIKLRLLCWVTSGFLL